MKNATRALMMLIVITVRPSFAASTSAGPTGCKNHGKPFPTFNNSEVLKWKKDPKVANQFESRGYVQGTVTWVYPDKNGHSHFELLIGKKGPSAKDPDPAKVAAKNDRRRFGYDTVEIIYSQDFGPLPKIAKGMNVEVCGDFIKSTDDTAENPHSPDGALIHWVHMSSGGHDDGFVKILSHGRYVTYGWLGNGKGGAHQAPIPLAKVKIQRLPAGSCLKTDSQGVILNPNYGVKGKPYKNYYGFVYDGTQIFKVSNAGDDTVLGDMKSGSVDEFFKSRLKVDPTSLCATTGVTPPAPASAKSAP